MRVIEALKAVADRATARVNATYDDIGSAAARHEPRLELTLKAIELGAVALVLRAQ